MEYFTLGRCVVVLCLLAVVCNGVNADVTDDPFNFNNFDSLADNIEETYSNALKLGVGIIVAIVIGIIAVVVLVIVLCACCCYHCCCKSRPASHTVVVTQGAQQRGMVMQQPVTYEPVHVPSNGPDAVPPYPDQQASYGYVKL
ncbi:protein shisa-5-like [Patiria miniata]|uniref:Uncharacterized protein n=1 Tax=Patiria miniata TaxID=46514 RepID=A0A914AZ00_PATMI|nr:protein shisa-5-like [Patiria miniata]